jgi:hypothetical protein
MARATTCQLDDRRIDITEALALRTHGRKQPREALDFLCIQCGKPVRPHKESVYGAAHFEHLRCNPNCSLSDPARC